jgi:hypothetical protein
MATIDSWRLSQKIAFRFFFILLGLSTFKCLVLVFTRILDIKNSAVFYKSLSGPFQWIDHYIFHTGYDPVKHLSSPQDNHFGVLFYLVLFVISVTGTIIWTILDTKRPEYIKALYWFRLYLRYVLALVLFFYGIDKVIPVQMPYPNIATLLTPIGENGRYSLLWNFMGISTGYMIMTGFCEIAASLLLMSSRTKVLGFLLAAIVLVNVVALNIFYNVPVKIFSISLLIYDLFLLYPYLAVLGGYFLFGKTSSLVESRYSFEKQWKHRSLIFGLVGVPLIFFWIQTRSELHRYRDFQSIRVKERIYDTYAFISKDSPTSLLTDTIRWRRLLFSGRNDAVIINMQDLRDYYSYDIDPIRKTITFHDNPDTLTWHVFQYTFPRRDQYSLTGKWKGHAVQILMNSVPIDSLRINKEIIKWVND